jgi:hypothetical protein
MHVGPESRIFRFGAPGSLVGIVINAALEALDA